jgi:hypothetical protein
MALAMTPRADVIFDLDQFSLPSGPSTTAQGVISQ